MKTKTVFALLLGGVVGGAFADVRTIDGVDYVYLKNSVSSWDAFNAAENWSDGCAPEEGKNYLVADGLSVTIGTTATFAGDSLMVGTADSDGYVAIANSGSYLTAKKFLLKRGSMETKAGNSHSGIRGPVTILSDASNPFSFLGSTTTPQHGFTFGLYSSLISGSTNAVFRAASSSAVSGTQPFRLSVQNSASYTLAGAPMTNYFGRIVVDGQNVSFGFDWHSGNQITEGMIGADPGFYMADAITLKNGGIFQINSAFSTQFHPVNRGITVVGEDGGFFSSSGTKYMTMNVAGDGPLKFSSSMTAIWNGAITCPEIEVGGSTEFSLHEKATFGSATTLHLTGGFFTTPEKGLACRVVYDSGTIRSAVGAGNVYIYPTQTCRSSSGKVGTLAMSADSVLNATPVAIALESSITGPEGGRFKILTIPTSVQTVTASDFSSGRTVEVTTEGSLQTVSLGYSTTGSAYVVPPGTAGVNPVSPYSSWETATTNIADAVAAATAYSCVFIREGTYPFTAAVTVDKNIRLESVGLDGGRARAKTILDGQGANRIFYVTANAASFSGFTFRNGYTTGNGGAILFNGTMSCFCVIEDSTFTDCVALSKGGALAWDGTSCTRVRDCSFLDNVAHGDSDGGGAIYSYAAQERTDWYSAPLLENSFFAGNMSISGAIGLFRSIRVDGCVFSNNLGRARVDGRVAKENSPTGTAVFYGSSLSPIDDSLFIDNSAGMVMDGAVTTTRCRFIGNSCSGCLFRGGSGTPPETVDCIVSNNTAKVFMDLYAHARIFRNTLLADNSFSGNFIESHQGYAGIKQFENATFANNTIAGAFWSGSNGGANLGIRLENTVFYGNTFGSHPALSSAMTFVATNVCTDCASVLSFPQQAAVFETDPKFVDSAAGDYHLKRNSPCRDKGSVSSWMTDDSTDLDGRPRRLDRQGQATADALPDLGCYECDQAKTGAAILLR